MIRTCRTSTATISNLASWKFYSPRLSSHPFIPGTEFPTFPCFSFLVHNRSQDRTVVFDLAIRKDWWNLAPHLVRSLKDDDVRIAVEKDVQEILAEGGVDTAAVEAVIWSHPHFDHMGDPSTFPKSTALVVGTGAREASAYGAMLESDVAGREVREVNFTAGTGTVRIGRFDAVDYFGDGSFYLLDTKGHTAGHMGALARVTSEPDSFILLGGDATHHVGELRPSSYVPLPERVCPDRLTGEKGGGRETGSFEKLLADGDRTGAFYEPAVMPGGHCVHHSVEQAKETISKIQEFDAADNIMVMMAHDASLLDVVDFFPKQVDDFMSKGWKEKARWRFLKDFAEAI
ncbi:hypothetical protein DL546_002810 [Coniochaeta pulveracea]|uniref:Metallo-beta-lactamase domain-containing protein n=1 Tax=Coniochaeta pulveracea TaxID=177199 RepID=A0A420Y548_9PEZI|nr:hypothetical protein DL546_002810 [Coniochaeta pulveracea]